MPIATRYFTVMAPEGLSRIPLDSKGCATCQITVKNVSQTAIDGRGILISLPVTHPQSGAVEKGWVTIDGPADRHFDVDEQEVFSIKIAVPQPKKGEPARPAGNYGFRLGVVNIARPDESADESQAFGFTVPVYAPPPRSNLPLILMVVAAGVLLIGAIATWLLLKTPTLALASGVPGSPVVGHNLDGRLEVFVVAKNGDLWHRVQAAPNGSFGPWQTLAGGSALISLPRVVYSKDGSMEIFGTQTGGVLWHIAQAAPNGVWNSGAALGAPAGGIVGSVTVVALPDGESLIFGAGSDHQLHAIGRGPDGRLGPWGNFFTMGAISDPTLVSYADVARLGFHVFVFSNDQLLQGATFGKDLGSWTPWGPPPGVPAWQGAPPPNVAPFVGTNADGRFEVFTTNGEGAVCHLYQRTPSDMSLSGWSLLLAPANGVKFLRLGAVANNKDGRFQLFFIGSDGGLWTLAQSVPSGWWGQVLSLSAPPGQLLNPNQIPASGLNADGTLTVFVNGTDGHVWHASQTSPGGSWGSLAKD